MSGGAVLIIQKQSINATKTFRRYNKNKIGAERFFSDAGADSVFRTFMESGKIGSRFVAVAVYYILLLLIRFLLLRFMRAGNRSLIDEYRRYSLSAILMMLIDLTLSVIVLNMIRKNESAEFSDIYGPDKKEPSRENAAQPFFDAQAPSLIIHCDDILLHLSL